jgi:hypothetical protein
MPLRAARNSAFLIPGSALAVSTRFLLFKIGSCLAGQSLPCPSSFLV